MSAAARKLIPLLVLAPAFAHASPRAVLSPAAPAEPSGWTERLVRYGDQPGQVGFRPASSDFPGDGVASVAVAPDGAIWLLDRLNARLVRVGSAESFEVGADAEDLAIGADGVIAAYSPLRAKVWFYEAGRYAAEVPVPRQIEEVVGIELGRSRQVLVRTSYQQVLSIGSPSIPQLFQAALATARDGAFLLSAGRGVSARVTGDLSEFVVLERGDGRAVERAKHSLGPNVLSARVIGVAGETACARLEADAGGKPFKVARRLACVDVRTGERLVDEALPDRGPWLPRRELAVGGSRPVIVHLAPSPEGLRVRVRALPAGGAR
jgi:hypothetical protein